MWWRWTRAEDTGRLIRDDQVDLDQPDQAPARAEAPRRRRVTVLGPPPPA